MDEESIPLAGFGRRIGESRGIASLMEDLGAALADPGGGWFMLGGGNPAVIPQIRDRWRNLMEGLLHQDPDRFDRMLGHYDPQAGNERFRRAVSGLFRRTYGWDVGPENVAITNGGQTAHFTLFNLLAGEASGGRRQRILFPQCPEYIGYAGQGMEPGLFESVPSRIADHGDGTFTYHIDFDAIDWRPDIAAACVSRPTNPTGNVLDGDEIRRLHEACRANGSLLLIDHAYGAPFPGIVFEDAEPFWDEGVVLTFSLSKLGLPGTRTGIVLGPPALCRAIAAMTAVVGLANGNVGQALTLPLFESGEILELSRNVIRPYYEERAQRALGIFAEAFEGLPLRIHRPRGAMFLWLRFPGLPGGSSRLYEKLKEKRVLAVPGSFFFHNLREDWDHAQECLRINHSMDIDRLPEAARRMAEVVGER